MIDAYVWSDWKRILVVWTKGQQKDWARLMPTMMIDHDDDTQNRPMRILGSNDNEKVATPLLDLFFSQSINEFEIFIIFMLDRLTEMTDKKPKSKAISISLSRSTTSQTR